MQQHFVIKHNSQGELKDFNIWTGCFQQAISVAEACAFDWLFIANVDTCEVKTKKMLNKDLLVY